MECPRPRYSSDGLPPRTTALACNSVTGWNLRGGRNTKRLFIIIINKESVRHIIILAIIRDRLNPVSRRVTVSKKRRSSTCVIGPLRLIMTRKRPQLGAFLCVNVLISMVEVRSARDGCCVNSIKHEPIYTVLPMNRDTVYYVCDKHYNRDAISYVKLGKILLRRL